MRARDVHGAVETLPDEPVRLGSVKKCLSSNVTGVSPRFVRVARGCYVASPATSDVGASGSGRKQACKPIAPGHARFSSGAGTRPSLAYALALARNRQAALLCRLLVRSWSVARRTIREDQRP